MSVDFYACDSCGDARYEEMIQECPSCGRSICDDCLNENIETPQRIQDREDITDEQYEDLCKKYGNTLIDDEVIQWGALNPECCPFCSGKEVHNDDLLDYALFKLDMTMEQLTQQYTETKGGTI